MGKSSAKQEVNEYSMSIHCGICHGPIDAVTGLFVGEKLAWAGLVVGQQGVYINAPSLFGGPKDEGGVGGVMYYLPGDGGQVLPNQLAARFGLTSNTSPAFRGLASVFFIGTDGVPAGSLYTGGSGTDPASTGGGATTGGGSYTTGGSGAGGGGGSGTSCVVADAWLPDGRHAAAVVPGDTMRVLTGDAIVRHAELATGQPCVTLVSFTGIRCTVSKTTPFTCEDGRIISVMDCYDEMCAVEDVNGFRWERIVGVYEAGNRDVMKIDLGGETFAAGDEEGRFLYTHNKAEQQQLQDY